MLDFYNNYNPYPPEPDPMKGLTDEERMKVARWSVVGYLLAIALGLLICAVMGSCTTPRAVEEHHHHHYEADTMAVKAQVDRQLTSWHEEMTQFFNERLEQFSSQMQQSEHQQETISELITVTTDSVGRSIRQEQRTISRDITRELQQQEQRLTREMQAQLRVVVDSVNDVWQQRFDSLASHVEQLDSAYISHQPSSIDHRPWHQKLWAKALLVLLGAALLFFAIKALLSWIKTK